MPAAMLHDIPSFPTSAAQFRSLVKSVSILGTSATSSRQNSVSLPAPSRPVSALPDSKTQQSQVISNVLAHVHIQLAAAEAAAAVDGVAYQGSKEPEISIGDYFERLVKYANNFSQDQPGPASSGIRALLLGMQLVERSQIKITRLNVHRLFLTALLLAIKSHEDYPISHKFWGQVGGVSMEDLNKMERDLCAELKFTLHVRVEQYHALQSRFGVFSAMDV
ncbi:hypothetical protein BASA81_001885 [Batrachochytrium salamandrivorans]|nr:hypothetical protein BASA81_001885 [Batrachochytrium salamandrivorans]